MNVTENDIALADNDESWRTQPKAETVVQRAYVLGPVVFVPHYLAGLSVPDDTFVGPGNTVFSAAELIDMGAKATYRALWARPTYKEPRR